MLPQEKVKNLIDRHIELENQLSKQKYINRAIAVAIIVTITIIFIVS